MSPQQPTQTQDSSSIVKEKCMRTIGIEKGKSIAIDASSSHVVANNNNKISNNGKAVIVASDKEETEEKVYVCQYCEKEFACQQAMAGHSNIHRSEWTLPPSPKRKRKNRKIQSDHKHLKQRKPSPYCNSIIAQLQKSFAKSSSTPRRDAASTSHKPLHHAADCPWAKPLNILEGPLTRAPLGSPPRHSLANPLNILEGPSARAPLGPPPRYSLAKSLNVLKGPLARGPLGPPPRHSLGNSKNTLKIPSLAHSLASLLNTIKETSDKYHLAQLTNTFNRRSKPARVKLYPYPKNTHIWTSIGAPQRTFIGPKNTLNMSSITNLNQPSNNREKPHGMSPLGGTYDQSMIHKPSQRGHLGHADKSVRIGPESLGRKQIQGVGTDSSSRYVCGGNIKSCEFAFFPLTPSKKRHNHGVGHSSQGSELQSGNNGEDVDDVDLKL